MAGAHAGSPRRANDGRERVGAFCVGDVLSGIFELRRRLGKGGMGQVFEAHDRLLNRRVAIKVAWPDVPGRPIHAEAQALAALHHPSVVTIYALGEHEGVEYAVMELLHGKTLEVAVEETRADAGVVPIEDARAILALAAEGLAAVHGAGIAHYDVKPANVMLAQKDRVVLTDFGIYRAESHCEHDGVVAGTPRYMAPERFLDDVSPGERSSSTCTRSASWRSR